MNKFTPSNILREKAGLTDVHIFVEIFAIISLNFFYIIPFSGKRNTDEGKRHSRFTLTEELNLLNGSLDFPKTYLMEVKEASS